jgi:hypothetical protein
MGFRLGCIEKKNGKFSIVSERTFVHVDLNPASQDTNECRVWESNDRLLPSEACSEGKLAVVEVKLADDRLWKLNP